MDFHNIKFLVSNSIAEIIFNSPEKLNSITKEISEDIQNALDICNSDNNIRVVIIKGEGRAFSAGQDLSEAVSGKYEINEIVDKHYNPIILRIRRLPKPVIAAVNGIAAGAGANIALACDIVLASESSQFIQAFSKIGLIPDSGGTFFLPRLVGLQKASALMLLGDKVSGKEAFEMGMVYKCISDDRFDEEVSSIASKLSGMPTKAIGLTKKLLNSSYSNNLEEQLEMEKLTQTEAGNSYDYQEGVDSFLEKRKPDFKGK